MDYLLFHIMQEGNPN